MKILITGISGFLGSNLLPLCKDHEVAGVSRSGGADFEIPVCDFEALDHLSFNPDAVIHCHAAVVSGKTVLDPEALFAGNVAATQKIVSQFPKARHIYASTVSVYGLSLGTLDETTPPSPVNAYAQSKLDGEQVVAKAAHYAIVRFPSLYGPGMKEDTLVPNYANQALNDAQITVWGDGSRRQSYLHVTDAASLLLAVAEKELQSDKGVFLGTAMETFSNKEVAEIMAAQTGAAIAYCKTDASLSVDYNPTFTQNAVNWQPKIPLAEGLKAYLAWKRKPY